MADGVVQVALPPKLIPVFEGDATYRVAYGGRGSGKTRSFAIMACVHARRLAEAGCNGQIICARQFLNSLADSSFSEIKEAIASEPEVLGPYFDVGVNYIRTRDKRIEFTFVGLHKNINSVKSRSRVWLLWVDEAETITEKAWETVLPSVREDFSEIWVTWNPAREASATHQRFRLNPPDDCRGTELNWRDNPRFPAILERLRLEDEAKRPDQYRHIWEGDFVTLVEGAYFVKQLNAARDEKRIGRVAADPVMKVKAFIDIGGTGDRSDSFALWIAQFAGREIRVLNYYEAQGQPLSTHINWLRDNGYESAEIILPHDGTTHDRVYDVTYESAFMDAGFDVDTIPNQGKGAAMKRVEAVRRLFPSIWINQETTKAGIEALGWYHPKIDDNRSVDLGPMHDWSSHGADAFGLMCVAYERPKARPTSFTLPESTWVV